MKRLGFLANLSIDLRKTSEVSEGQQLVSVYVVRIEIVSDELLWGHRTWGLHVQSLDSLPLRTYCPGK